MTALFIILIVLITIVSILFICLVRKSLPKFIVRYKDYRIRKYCVKHICNSSITKPYGRHYDPDSGAVKSEPLSYEAYSMYRFLKGINPEPPE